MSTRKPKTIEQAEQEVATAMDEIIRAQGRLKKAATFLIHQGNTPSRSSCHYHFAVAISDANRLFTDTRVTLFQASKKHQEEQGNAS